MSKLRKLMAVIVSVAMLVSLFVAPAFAEQTMTDIEVCELLDVLRGTGDGLTAEYLASKPTRYQAARLFLRLQGLEEEAIAFEGAANFSDVEALADWQLAPENKALIAYLYANSELGFIGYTDGTFRPFNEITAMEYYKVLLTALGYEQGEDFEYGEDMLEFAAGLGLSEVAAVEEFTIRHLATATVEALKAVVKDSDKTLLEKLVADGVIDEEDAIATGLYGEEVVALEVVEMYGDNMAELYVKFNQAMDKDTIVADNFKVGGEKVGAAALLDDGVTAKLTIAYAKIGGNGTNYEVEISKDVKSATGMAFEEAYKEKVRVFDNELPFVTDVRLTGPKTIEITFSEPIEEKPTVKINKGVYGCSVGDIKSVTNKVIVTIAASKLPEGDYTLAISDAKDFAGFKMDADEWALAYAADESPITAEVTSAKQSEVKVKFNKPVKLTDTATSYFYHTFSRWTPDSVNNDDGEYHDSYTLTFTEHPIPEGDTQFVIKAKGEGGTAIRDAWGNKLEENIVITVSVTADLIPPTVEEEVEVKDDAQAIVLKFSEPLNKDSAEKKGNYAVEDEDGKEVKIKNIEYSDADDEYTVTIKFDKELSGNYTIIISGVKDASVNENEIVETTLSFFVGDKKAPEMEKVSVTYLVDDGKNIIYVTYPEKMATEGKYSVLDADNYLIGKDEEDPVKLPSKTKLELFGSTGMVVKITLPDNKLDLSDAILYIARVADLAGNVTPLLMYDYDIEAEEGPKVIAVEQTAKNKLTFKVDTILESVLADAFVFVKNGDSDDKGVIAAGIEEWTVKDGETIIQVIVNADFIKGLTGYGDDSGKLITDFARIKIDGQHMVAETGKKGETVDDITVGNAEKGINPVTVEDKWVPTFVEIVAVEKTVADAVYDSIVKIKFSEVLDPSGKSNFAHDLVIEKPDGKALVANIDYKVEVLLDEEGKPTDTLEITIKGVDVLAGVDDGDIYTVATKDTINYIKGEDDNKIATFDAKDIVEPEDDDE